jgi:hypothetical protein
LSVSHASSGGSNDSSFDDFTLYLMLSARLDIPTALRAADTYTAGSEVLYSKACATCFRAAVVGVDSDSDAFLRKVLIRWTRTMPDAAMDASGGQVAFHSCDPGSRATTPSDTAINRANSLAVNRDAMVAEFVTEHVPSDLAACAARVLVEQPSIRSDLLNNKAPTNRDQLLTQAAGAACRENPYAAFRRNRVRSLQDRSRALRAAVMSSRTTSTAAFTWSGRLATSSARSPTPQLRSMSGRWCSTHASEK